MQLTTEQLAAQLGLRAASLRHRVCVAGSYFGVRPTKLANGRLLWPGDSVERLIADAQRGPDAATAERDARAG
jgi:hypothetical protein